MGSIHCVCERFSFWCHANGEPAYGMMQAFGALPECAGRSAFREE